VGGEHFQLLPFAPPLYFPCFLALSIPILLRHFRTSSSYSLIKHLSLNVKIWSGVSSSVPSYKLISCVWWCLSHSINSILYFKLLVTLSNLLIRIVLNFPCSHSRISLFHAGRSLIFPLMPLSIKLLYFIPLPLQYCLSRSCCCFTFWSSVLTLQYNAIVSISFINEYELLCFVY